MPIVSTQKRLLNRKFHLGVTAQRFGGLVGSRQADAPVEGKVKRFADIVYRF